MWSQERLVKTVSKESLMEVNKPLSRMDIFYSGSVTNLSRRFTNSRSLLKLLINKSIALIFGMAKIIFIFTNQI